MYANAGPNAAAFQALLDQWQQANPGATSRHGGGPGDVGFGPGIMPSWYQGTPGQQSAVDAVAGNPNLQHGWQASAIPQWQIDGEYPGGNGWQPGVTPMPPGWQGQSSQQSPAFGGPPSSGSQGPGFEGGPTHQGGFGWQRPGDEHKDQSAAYILGSYGKDKDRRRR
jgi:hypothetical protein